MNKFKFSISLRIFSESIDPFDVSKRLHLTPKWINKKGEQRKTPRGRIVDGVYEVNYCSFELAVDNGLELHEEIKRHIDALSIYKDVFEMIRADGGRVEFFVGWFSSGNTGDLFKFDLLYELSQMQIDLAFDIYGSA